MYLNLFTIYRKQVYIKVYKNSHLLIGVGVNDDAIYQVSYTRKFLSFKHIINISSVLPANQEGRHIDLDFIAEETGSWRGEVTDPKTTELIDG